jgi:septal ring factor EnvC (AmiA/AmiB activator)
MEKLQANKRVKKLRLAHSYLSNKISSLQRAQTLLDQSNEPVKPANSGYIATKNSMEWPIDGDISIVRPFGYSENIVGTNEFSAGIDISVIGYKVIKASAPGTVVYRGPFSDTYGNIVMLDHGGAPNNIFTIYGNLDQIFVPNKEVVTAGAAIGTVGEEATLRGKETTFHFEIRKKTTPVDPLEWLKIKDLKNNNG